MEEGKSERFHEHSPFSSRQYASSTARQSSPGEIETPPTSLRSQSFDRLSSTFCMDSTNATTWG